MYITIKFISKCCQGNIVDIFGKSIDLSFIKTFVFIFSNFKLIFAIAQN